jgi:predicted Zn-dependent protease
LPSHYLQQRFRSTEVREAVRLEPQAALFHVYEGRVLTYAHRAEEAVEKLEPIVHLDPALFVAQLWLALASIDSGQFDRAIEVSSSMADERGELVATCCLSYVLARRATKTMPRGTWSN